VTGDGTPAEQRPTVTLRAPARARSGDGVIFAVHVESRTKTTVYLRGRRPTAEIVLSRDGTVVWRSLEGATIPAVVQVVTITPAAPVRIDVRWDGRGRTREPLRPGVYRAHAELLTDLPEPIRSAPIALEVLAR
jgi:hypothetical protein